MSGIGKVVSNDLSMLEQLSKMSTGSIKVTEDGKRLVLDEGMTFKSGLRRMFGREKSTEDVEQNQKTMNTILDYIKRNTSDQVYNKVLNSGLRMGGDRNDQDFSVRDRLERGTYVSPKLVGELLQITRTLVEEENENMRPFQEESRTQVNQSLSGSLSGGLLSQESVRTFDRQEILKDEHTFGQFQQYLEENRGRLISSFDGQIEAKARRGETLDRFDINQHAKNFISNTLLPEFIDAQPERKHFNRLTDHEIGQGVREYFENNRFTRDYESHVDAIVRRFEEGGDEVKQLRQEMAIKLEQTGRGMVSSEELVELLDPKKMNDLLSEQVRRR